MREKLGLTRRSRRLDPYQPSGRIRKKFYIFQDEERPYWYVLIPTLLLTFHKLEHQADWYAFDNFEDARKWVADKLTYHT